MTHSPSPTFNITFPNGNSATAILVPTFANAAEVANALQIPQPKGTIFISGGASAMDDEAIARTHSLIEGGIVQFAKDHDIVIVDGGTNAGIMRMIGQARHKLGASFPLIGCAPHDKLTYPGSPAADDPNSRTPLESHHTHFVLVDADYWGAESDIIVDLTRAIAQKKYPNCGILINGGGIAKYDIYIASARGASAIPVIVVDGSGRTADEIAMASRTGKFANAMIRAIVEGGQIDEVSLSGGPGMIYEKLKTLFEGGSLIPKA